VLWRRPRPDRRPLAADPPQPDHQATGADRADSPTPVRLAALVIVAGTRWRIEESFQSGKELAALDQRQVRRWTSWHRWTALARLAHALVSVLTATAWPPDPGDRADPL
jgi:SRSO17 transposase